MNSEKKSVSINGFLKSGHIPYEQLIIFSLIEQIHKQVW